MSVGSNFKARLLLEGREVPFVSASIIATPGSPQICNLSLVPHAKIKAIRPKTQVHLLVRDSLSFGDDRFYLAFEGEVSGRGYDRSGTQRAFQLVALDYSVYWDEAKAYYWNPNFILGKIGDYISGTEQSSATTTKAVAGKQISGLSTIQSYMLKVILGEKDVVAGVGKVLSSLGQGNPYLKAAYERLRIADRMSIYSSGRLKDFLKDLNIEEFMNGFNGKQGGLYSLREMLLETMQMFFHEYISIPFPPYYSASNTLGGYLFVPDSYPLPPPKNNVIFPNKIVDFSFNEDFRAAPTRFGYQASLPEFVGGQIGKTKYQMLYYPNSMYNYMYKGGHDLGDEAGSLLDRSTIFDYGGGNFGDKKTDTGNPFGPTKREMDFLTNEEAIRGIFYEYETFPPAVTALVSKSPVTARNAFTDSVGKYLFFKKRFGARNGRMTLMFSPYIAPGLNGVILDDSDAGQSMIAKFQTVTHTITNSAALSTVELGYVRDFDEVDLLSGGTGDPPLPTWFDPSVFGSVNKAQFDKETGYLKGLGAIDGDEELRRKQVKNPITYPSLSKYYNAILNCDSITNSDTPSSRGAVQALVQKYKSIANDAAARDTFTFAYVKRPIATMGEAMYFLGAIANPEVKGQVNPDSIIPDDGATFKAFGGSNFDGGANDKTVLKYRREIIDDYIKALKSRRGFRG